jgi:hypothetical protein
MKMQTTKIKYIPGWEYCSECNDGAARTKAGYVVHMKQIHGKEICPHCLGDITALNQMSPNLHQCGG